MTGLGMVKADVDTRLKPSGPGGAFYNGLCEETGPDRGLASAVCVCVMPLYIHLTFITAHY